MQPYSKNQTHKYESVSHLYYSIYMQEMETFLSNIFINRVYIQGQLQRLVDKTNSQILGCEFQYRLINDRGSARFEKGEGTKGDKNSRLFHHGDILY